MENDVANLFNKLFKYKESINNMIFIILIVILVIFLIVGLNIFLNRKNDNDEQS